MEDVLNENNLIIKIKTNCDGLLKKLNKLVTRWGYDKKEKKFKINFRTLEDGRRKIEITDLINEEEYYYLSRKKFTEGFHIKNKIFLLCNKKCLSFCNLETGYENTFSLILKYVYDDMFLVYDKRQKSYFCFNKDCLKFENEKIDILLRGKRLSIQRNVGPFLIKRKTIYIFKYFLAKIMNSYLNSKISIDEDMNRYIEEKISQNIFNFIYGPFLENKVKVHFSDGIYEFDMKILTLLNSEFIFSQLDMDIENLYFPIFNYSDILYIFEKNQNSITNYKISNISKMIEFLFYLNSDDSYYLFFIFKLIFCFYLNQE